MPFKCVEPGKLYARDANLKKKDVEILEEWLKKQPHLPQLHETQILLALHSCYYRVEATKTAIDSYYTIRSLCPDIFVALTPEVLKATSLVTFINVLPQTTPEGYGIIMVKLLDLKPDNFNCANFVNFVNMVTVLHIYQHGFFDGVLILFDMKGLSLGHLGRLNLNVLKHGLYFIQEGVPVRIKGIHFMNALPLADKFIALIKPFMKRELYDMMQMHPPGSESLYKSVPKECLPEDCGGQSPSCQTLNGKNVENLLHNYDFFKWHDLQLVDESKRIGVSKIVSDVFGADGTFKKLEID